MRVLPLLLAAAAAGCSTDLVERREFQDMDQRLEQFRAQSSTRFDLMTQLYNDLVTRHEAMAKKVAEAEKIVSLMEHSVARMEDIIKNAGGNPAPAAKGGGDEPPGAKPLKIEDILLETERNLTLLRAGKVRLDEVIQALKPYAKITSARLTDELRTAITQVDYSKQLEAILSEFPTSELKVPLQRALANRGSRESAARIIGNTKDRELSAVLEEYATTSDEDFRLALGEALVRCRNASGIPLLVRCLASGDGATRIISFDALKRLNQGKDFGYRSTLGPDDNAAAIKQWEEWAGKFGKVLFD